MTKVPRTIAEQARVDGSASENGLPTAVRQQLESEIRQLLATETDPVLLSNKLFSQGGLFSQLAGSEQERRKVAQSPLFKQAQERLMEMRQREIASRQPSNGSPRVIIASDQELSVTLERIARLQAQVAHLRRTETNPANYHASTAGFLAEIDRMQLEVREYLSLHPTELAVAS